MLSPLKNDAFKAKKSTRVNSLTKFQKGIIGGYMRTEREEDKEIQNLEYFKNRTSSLPQVKIVSKS